VLTIDQNMLFAAAGQDGNLFTSLFVEPLAIGLGRCRKRAGASRRCCRTSSLESSSPRQGHTLMLDWLARCILLMLARVQAERRIAEKSGRNDFELFSRFRVEVERHYKEQWRVGQYAASCASGRCA
jgi:AraC family transcriptional activator of pobA